MLFIWGPFIHSSSFIAAYPALRFAGRVESSLVHQAVGGSEAQTK